MFDDSDSSSSASTDSSSSKNVQEETSSKLSAFLVSSSSTSCNFLISQLFEHKLIENKLCTFCHRSVHLHANTATQLSTSSSTSKSVLDKNVIHDLPQWKKDYKICNTFFNTLEQLFSVHNISDESLYKRYLHLTLTELHDSDRTYAFNNIINTDHSWSEIKVLFADRFETFDHVNRLRKQYNDIRYTHNDTIQTFSNRFINICNDLAYPVDDSQTIHKFLTLLPTDMHRRLLLSIEMAEKSIDDYKTLSSLVQKIIRLENAQNNAAFVTSSGDHHSSSKNTSNNNFKNKNTSSSSSSSSSSSTSTPRKHCVHHPASTNHSTSECRTGPSKSSSSGMMSPLKLQTSSSSSAYNSPAAKTQVVCHHCNEMGHIKPNCPQLTVIKKSQPPPLSTMTRSAYNANGVKPTFTGPTAKAVTFANSSNTSVKSLATSDSSSSDSDISFKTVDRTIPIDVCSLNISEHPILLPITIQGHLFYGLPDTGASSSCLDPLIPAKFGLKITPVKGKVKMADVNVQSDRIGTCDMTVEITIPDNNIKVKLDHTYEVFPVFEKDKGYHFIIGRDILGPLFHKGLSPSLFLPDAHVKLPVFHDDALAAVVNSMRPVDTPSHTSQSISTSTIQFNRLEFVDHSDIIDIDVKQSAVIINELKSMQTYINEDIKSLSSDIHDLGAGSVPDCELPVRPSLHSESDASISTIASDSTPTKFDLSSTTPDSIKQQYGRKLNTLLVHLCANEAITGFCTLPGAQVELIIDESKKHLLFRRQYPIPQTLWSLANEVILRWFDTGKTMLAPVGCEFNLPLTIAPKKDDNGQLTGIRVCLDTRILNSILLSTDKFLIPQIRDTIEMFAHCALFGEFDLSEAYLQFPLHPDSRKYTAFTWNNVQYMFAGVPFGINFIPSHFQRQLSQLFHDLSFTIPYFDNLPFGSGSWDEHLDHAIMIVDRLNQVNLKVKPSSVKIGRTSMKCLGHILSTQGIGIDPDKVASISNHPFPPTGDNMMAFLGETGYVSHHVRNYAELSAPLQAVKFQKTIEWTDEMKMAFTTLKHAVCNAPFLQFPDFALAFHVAPDASNTGIGGVLYQPKFKGEHITPYNIVAIYSKVLTEPQRRYPAYKKELYAIVACLRRFHSYIWGRNDLVIVTDHKPLTYILESKQLSPALQQWLDVILDYNFEIEHRDGILHVLPDRLSRLYTDVYASSTWGVASTPLSIVAGVDENTVPSSFPVVKTISVNALTRSQRRTITHTDKQELVPPSPNPSSSSSSMGEEIADTAINNNNSNNNNNNNNNIEDLPSNDNNADEENDIEFTDPDLADQRQKEIDLAIELEKRGKIVVRDPIKQKELIVNTHLHGHFGVTAVYNKLWQSGFWWPKIRNDIQEVLSNCDACTRFTVTKSGYHPFTPISATGPGDHFQIDLSTHLPPSSDGYNTLLAVIDVYTGFVILRPMRNSKAETVARKLWKIFCLIGWPRILQSDNGSEFVNEVLRALVKLAGIDHRLISPYNPRADGKVERVIGSTMMIIKKLLHGAKQNWSIYVPFAQVTFNDKVASLTGSTHFSLMFGRSLNELKDYTQGHEPTPIPLSDWEEHQNKIISLIYPAISERIKGAKEKLAQTLTKHRRMLLPASVPTGATVMIKDVTRENKFEPKYVGPYVIVRRARNGAYVLRDVDGDILDRHIPIDQIKIISKTSRTIDKDTYTVSKVLKHRGAPGSYEYLVQWKNYSSDENTWEHESQFNDTKCIEKYWASFKRSN